MSLTKVQRFILFSLGKWFEEANARIKDKQWGVAISKFHFIGLVLKAGFAKKQRRALYKNLESLEKKRLVSYENKELFLTLKGERAFAEIKKSIDPYIDVVKKLQEKSPTSYTKKVQTVFR